jgi:hypothetical protein
MRTDAIGNEVEPVRYSDSVILLIVALCPLAFVCFGLLVASPREVLDGFVHSSVAQSVSGFHGGLVLYNNGFAAGLVASVLVPVIVAVQPPAKNDGAT